MSVIGPRPGLWNQDILTAERDKYNANDVKPGLTGWAQINGRDELEIPVKAKLDGEYVSKMGLMMDIKCFLGSVGVFAHDDSVVEGGTGEMKKIGRHYTDGKSAEELIGHIGFGETVEVDTETKKRVLITGAGSYIGETFKAYAEEYYPALEITDINEINHPAIREAMKMLDMHEIRLTYEADLPARSGLGTSSSFAVGMLNAFYALKGKYADKRKLADEAIYLERVLCNESGGWQDQIAASFGGFNRINFGADGYEVLPVIISPERKKQLNNNLMMFFTGFTRFSSEVQKANAVSSPSDKKAMLKQMYDLVGEAENVLINKEQNLDDFGRLLDITWKLKRKTGGAVSTNSIDELYTKGINAGALM